MITCILKAHAVLVPDESELNAVTHFVLRTIFKPFMFVTERYYQRSILQLILSALDH